MSKQVSVLEKAASVELRIMLERLLEAGNLLELLVIELSAIKSAPFFEPEDEQSLPVQDDFQPIADKKPDSAETVQISDVTYSIVPEFDPALSTTSFYANISPSTFYSDPKTDRKNKSVVDSNRELMLAMGDSFKTTLVTKESAKYIYVKSNKPRRWLNVVSPHTGCKQCDIYGYWACPIHKLIYNKGYGSKHNKTANTLYYRAEVSTESTRLSASAKAYAK